LDGSCDIDLVFSMIGDLKLCDAMGAAFTNVRTFCQLYGANVCFTDMDHIVRDRVAQFPARFNLVHVWNALQIMGVSGTAVGHMTGEDCAQTLLDVYRTALTSEIMDAKQSEYYSDYGLYGVANATLEDAKKNLQPSPLLAYDVEALKAGEVWFYKELESKDFIRYMLRPCDDQKQVVKVS
jgi:hypothetical protein